RRGCSLRTPSTTRAGSGSGLMPPWPTVWRHDSSGPSGAVASMETSQRGKERRGDAMSCRPSPLVPVKLPRIGDRKPDRGLVAADVDVVEDVGGREDEVAGAGADRLGA